jgi:hypothetical protein
MKNEDVTKILVWGLKNSPRTSEPPHLDDETMAAYLDKMLSKEERAAAEEHMANCGDCLHELSEFFSLLKEMINRG